MVYTVVANNQMCQYFNLLMRAPVALRVRIWISRYCRGGSMAIGPDPSREEV
jgi:hypothetical protein